MGKKRGNGEGSIYQRSDGRWEARLRVQDGAGGVVRKSLYGDTREELQKKLHALQKQRIEGTFNSDARRPLGEFLTVWLEQHVRPSREIRTTFFYESLIRRHIVPEIGHIRLENLKPQVIQSFYAKKLKDGASKGLVKKVHITLHAALAVAERQQIILRNPAHFVTPPKPDRPEPKSYTPEEAVRFCAAVNGHLYECVYIMALDSACREGELLGLFWSDVDFASGTIRISRALKRIPGKIYFGPPKTPQSRRTIDLTSVSLRLLEVQRERQERMKLGKEWRPREGFENLVFTTETGNPIDGARLVTELKKICGRAGLPYYAFKGLRSSHSTLMAAKGVSPRVIQNRLGHSGLEMTLRAYTAVLPSMRSESVKVVESFVVRPKGGDCSIPLLPAENDGRQKGRQTGASAAGRRLIPIPTVRDNSGKLWFPMMDSNHHKQSQSLLSYH